MRRFPLAECVVCRAHFELPNECPKHGEHVYWKEYPSTGQHYRIISEMSARERRAYPRLPAWARYLGMRFDAFLIRLRLWLR